MHVHQVVATVVHDTVQCYQLAFREKKKDYDRCCLARNPPWFPDLTLISNGKYQPMQKKLMPLNRHKTNHRRKTKRVSTAGMVSRDAGMTGNDCSVFQEKQPSSVS